MKRIPISPRDNWQQTVLSQGFLFYNLDNYYTETAAYSFSLPEIEQIEKASATLYTMCLEVVERVISNRLYDDFMIPEPYREWIEWSWRNRQPSLYGRFDLAFNNGDIKLLEFNADTPTLLLESSVIQWKWLQDYNPGLDQYNHIHEALLARLGQISVPSKMLFTASRNDEDYMTVKYMEDVAAQSGIPTTYCDIDEVSLDAEGRFRLPDGELLRSAFKIYPWEWMFHEPFGEFLPRNRHNCQWFEPPWKAILSNKMLLPYLWKLFPESPYLVQAQYRAPGDTEGLPASYARKPVFSREGENVLLVRDGAPLEENEGEYGEEGHIYQDLITLPEFDGWHPIIGSWIIGDKPAGMGIRESQGLITNVTSSFAPHFIEPLVG
jgi:glutathionylspermidine synthase